LAVAEALHDRVRRSEIHGRHGRRDRRHCSQVELLAERGILRRERLRVSQHDGT
jgi:hypothetical protein